MTTSFATGGAHTITATYSGDTNLAGSSSPAFIITQATTTTLTSSLNPSSYGQSVTFTATVTSVFGTPGGTVTFAEGTSTLTTSVVNTSGVATFAIATLIAGTHAITATYAGNTIFGGSSGTLSGEQTVTQAGTTTAVTSSASPSSVFGQSVTFTAVVSCQLSVVSGASGTVTFEDGSTSLGTGSLNSSGLATFATNTLALGTHAITASYSGDTNFSTSSATLSGGLVVTPTSTMLIVTSFTPMPTGFVATFDHSLEVTTGSGVNATPVLHLYDDAFGDLGAPDVTVVGSSTGPVAGSLVVSTPTGGPVNSEVTFIQSGQTGIGQDLNAVGVLANDTYTVTLLSGNNGFQDTSGNQLDGNADGTPGVNYVTTFAIDNPTSSVTVSLPDFTRGPGQPVDVQNNTDSSGNIIQTGNLNSGVTNDVSGSGVPLSLHNNAGTVVTVTCVTLSLAYNPSLLTITAASAVPGGATATLDTTSTPGLALITFTDSTGLVLQPANATGDARDFVHLTATVPSTALYGAKEILDLQSININQGAYTSAGGTALDDAAIHAVGFLGDPAMEGQYGVTNALYTAMVAVSLQSGFKDWAMVDPVVIGDVTGDGQVNVDDALALAQTAVEYYS